MAKMLTEKQLASARRRAWPSPGLDALLNHIEAQADALAQAREAWREIKPTLVADTLPDPIPPVTSPFYCLFCGAAVGVCQCPRMQMDAALAEQP